MTQRCTSQLQQLTTLTLAETIEGDCATLSVVESGKLIQWRGNQMQKLLIEIRLNSTRVLDLRDPV